MVTQKEREDVKSYKKSVTCICPRCRREHKQQMLWIGNGKPRKLCKFCLSFSDRYDMDMEG